MAARGVSVCLESACSVAAALEAGRRGKVRTPPRSVNRAPRSGPKRPGFGPSSSAPGGNSGRVPGSFSPRRHLMSRTNLAFIGLDAGRFGGWLARFPSAPVVVRDTLGLDLDNPCLEIPVRDGGSGTLDLLQEDRVLPFLNAHHVSHLVVFKPSHRVQVWAESQGLRLVGGDVSLAQRLENKVQFTQMAAEFGLPVPPTDILTAPFPSWSDWVSQWGEQAVLQRARGHSGQGTFLVHSPEILQELSAGSRRGKWRVSPSWMEAPGRAMESWRKKVRPS